MTIGDYAAIIAALSAAVLAYYVARLSTRMERSAQVMDELMNSARRELELTMEESRGALQQLKEASSSAGAVLQQLSTIGNSLSEQLRKVDKVVSVADGIMSGLRVNSLLFEKAVASPLAKVTGAWAGISRGVKVFRQITNKGDKA